MLSSRPKGLDEGRERSTRILSPPTLASHLLCHYKIPHLLPPQFLQWCTDQTSSRRTGMTPWVFISLDCWNVWRGNNMNRPISRSVFESNAFEQFGEHGPLQNSFHILSSITTMKDTLSLLQSHTVQQSWWLVMNNLLWNIKPSQTIKVHRKHKPNQQMPGTRL